MSETLSIEEAQQICLERNVPFYSYRLPDESSSCFGAQTERDVCQFENIQTVIGSIGFMVEPFVKDDKNPSLFIRGDLFFKDATEDSRLIEKLRKINYANFQATLFGEDTEQRSYYDKVGEMIKRLQKDDVRKVVFARTITFPCDAFALASQWYKKLTENYPHAFVFLVSVPGIMAWAGAAPEVFLRQSPTGIETMSLAGTKPAGEHVWGEKEKEEQAIVTEYIEDIVQEFAGSDWQIEGPFTKSAGNVEHLCTTFRHEGALKAETVERLRRELHPTPAVGGMPKDKALALIKELEGIERRYYAGYLGPVHGDGTFDWFVNLRSMEMRHNQTRLYVGGGLTALSDGRKEWEETALKAHTLLSVIENG